MFWRKEMQKVTSGNAGHVFYAVKYLMGLRLEEITNALS
jgi:hypothetical protein